MNWRQVGISAFAQVGAGTIGDHTGSSSLGSSNNSTNDSYNDTTSNSNDTLFGQAGSWQQSLAHATLAAITAKFNHQDVAAAAIGAGVASAASPYLQAGLQAMGVPITRESGAMRTGVPMLTNPNEAMSSYAVNQTAGLHPTPGDDLLTYGSELLGGGIAKALGRDFDTAAAAAQNAAQFDFLAPRTERGVGVDQGVGMGSGGGGISGMGNAGGSIFAGTAPEDGDTNVNKTNSGKLDFWAATQLAKERMYLSDNDSNDAVDSVMKYKLGFDSSNATGSSRSTTVAGILTPGDSPSIVRSDSSFTGYSTFSDLGVRDQMQAYGVGYQYGSGERDQLRLERQAIESARYLAAQDDPLRNAQQADADFYRYAQNKATNAGSYLGYTFGDLFNEAGYGFAQGVRGLYRLATDTDTKILFANSAVSTWRDPGSVVRATANGINQFSKLPVDEQASKVLKFGLETAATLGAGKVASIAGDVAVTSARWGVKELGPTLDNIIYNQLSRQGLILNAAPEAPRVVAGANTEVASSRMAELNAKWGDLSASERRALLESKSEATWSNWLDARDAQAKAINPKTHFMEKHGPDTTLLDQEVRATQGIAPDRSIDKAFRDSTRFMSARDMGAAMQRADSIFQLNGGINKAYSFQMESFIGEGFTKAPNSNWMFTTNVNAVYRNGQPYTMFPLLRPIK